MKLLPVYLWAAISLPAQSVDSAVFLTRYLSLTPTQTAAIQANNDAYTAATMEPGRRVFELNKVISAEIRRPEPDASVISTGYREIESICKSRQPVHAELIRKNLAVLTEAQRKLMEPVQLQGLKSRLSSLSIYLGLRPPVPDSPAAANILFPGTSFGFVISQVADVRTSGVLEWMEFLQLSTEQMDAIVTRNKRYMEVYAEKFNRMVELSEILRANLVSAAPGGEQAVEIEKLRRELAEEAATLLRQNLETLDDAQRKQLDLLFAVTSTQMILIYSDAERVYLVQNWEPKPDRPATVALIQSVSPFVITVPMNSAGLSLTGSPIQEMYYSTRVCTAGPIYIGPAN